MVMRCAYCGEESQEGLRSLHMFPKSPEQQMCWIQNMGLDNFVFTNSMRLCSDHFEEGCLQKDGNLAKLKSGSTPTLFSTCKLACAYCNIVRNKNDRNQSFHKFPLKDPALLRKWLIQMRMEDFVPSTKSILCSNHFEKSCFYRRGKVLLKNDAVPTIFLRENREGKKKPHPPAKSSDLKFEGPSLKAWIKSTICENSEKAGLTANSLIKEETICLTEDTPQVVQNTVCLTEDRPGDTEKPDCLREDVLGGIQSSDNESAQCKNISVTIQHDHQYVMTPRSSKKKMQMMEERMRIMKLDLRNNNKKIVRLKKKVTTLKNIVIKLRKTRVLPELGFACLDSIADSDVSQ